MDVKSYLQESELDYLNDSPLDRKTPFLIRFVTQTQFSIARYYGGCKFNGIRYEYLPQTDELIRSDVLNLIQKMRKAERQRR